MTEELFTVPTDGTYTSKDGKESVTLSAGSQITMDEARKFGLVPEEGEPEAAEGEDAEAKKAPKQERAKGAAPENRSR